MADGNAIASWWTGLFWWGADVMARTSVQQPLPAMEVEKFDRAERGAREVKKLDRLNDLPLKTAKARMGACLREAIGTRPLKAYGGEALVSRVCNGDVPEYLARIYQDAPARRRLGLVLLNSEDAVTVTVTLPPLKETK
jgi:hypothetical protein